MGMNITEKIIAAHGGRDRVAVNEIVEVKVDWCMVNDVTIPITKEIFYGQFDFKRVFDTNKIKFIFDHRIPTDSIDTAQVHKIGRDFGNELGIQIHECDGVCHQVMFERYILPGQLIVAADSHTCSYGCIGAVSVGMGSTDIAAVMGTGQTWLKVPHTMKIILNGSLQKGVYAKDVILYIIREITSSGATYKTIEFCGDLVDKLSVSERFTLCNMAIEAGGKSAMIAPDDKVKNLYHDDRIDWNLLTPDSDAIYTEVLEFDVTELKPQVACPHYVDNVADIQEVEGTKIQQGFIGGCTNGRLDDLEAAARILKNKSIHKDVRLIIVPASVNIYQEAMRLGYIDIFLKAGAMVNHPGCSVCWGASVGSLAAGEVMISSANRNFKGRAGSKDSSIYLGSPATVAASAVRGAITNSLEEEQDDN